MGGNTVDLPEYITNYIGMKLRLIPAGSFMMGSQEGYDDEKPAHLVEITRPFYMGIYQVTGGLYDTVMGGTLNYFKGIERPVNSVNWNNADKFCCWLGANEGVTCRLPTEAEWEYACRAGTETKYYWGDDSSEHTVKKFAWNRENSGGRVLAVGRKRPNAWGLYDMSGNVWEWCADWYNEDYYQFSPSKDPRGPKSGKYRVLRGGSWNDYPRFLSVSFRKKQSPDAENDYVGFRVVREVE